MNRLSNPPPHRYTGAGFNRASQRRLDADWLSARRADPRSRVDPDVRPRGSGQRGRPAVRRGPDDRATRASRCPRTPSSWARRRTPRCSPSISAVPPRRSGRFVEVRAVGAWLSAKEAGWCAYARGARVLAQPAPLLRRLRRRHGQRAGRPHPALSDLRRPALPAQRPGGDRAGHPSPPGAWRTLPARPLDPFSRRPHSTLAGFVEPGESSRRRCAGRCTRNPGWRWWTCTTARPSPGRSRHR